MMTEPVDITIPVEGAGPVSALLVRPTHAHALLVLAHGAGAGMRHRFMARAAAELADRGVATLRYQFPYMEAGRKRTDRPATAAATVRAAVGAARREAVDLPLFAGGKSFGGRMTALAAADPGLGDVAGLVFMGFPLHPSGKPSVERASVLPPVPVPMLFVQGTRDSLADLDLLTPVVDGLGARATLHIVEGGDHSFAVLRRSGRGEDEVMAEIGDVVTGWIEVRIANYELRAAKGGRGE